jgi:benzylsuccinate CoA-transferase BbsE subunit
LTHKGKLYFGGLDINLNYSILKNIRVLDLSDEKGIFCSKVLADLGAEVIHIVKPGEPAAFNLDNTGKHFLSLNIEIEKGANLFRRLVKTSDMLVESYSPGFLASLGMGYAELKVINTRLIMVSITGFGQSGPDKDFKTSDLVASALGGQMSVCGDPDKPPLKPFGQQAFRTAGLFAANGLLLALWKRHSSKQGQYIDISIHECVAGTLDHVLVRYFSEGTIAERQGNLYWNQTFKIFPCRDGYILLSLFHQWETLVEWMDSEGMAEDLKDSKWRGENERRENLDHIIGVLGKWTRTHRVNELVELGQLMRFPWADIASIPQVVENPQLNQRY